MSPRLVPRALAPLTLALCAAGAAVSGYLTVVHYTTTVKLACSATGVINCEKVTTSAQSMVAESRLRSWGSCSSRSPRCCAYRRPGAQTHRLCGSDAWPGCCGGALMMIHLIYAELFQIDAICLWCTAVHVILVALFIAVVVGEAMVSQPQPAITTD